MHWLIHFGVLVLAFVVMGALIPGVRLRGAGTAILAALLFCVINLFFGWLVKVVLVVGTLGLALLALNFLTNLVVLWVTDKLMEDFEIRGFGALLLSGIVLTAANVVGYRLF